MDQKILELIKELFDTKFDAMKEMFQSDLNSLKGDVKEIKEEMKGHISIQQYRELEKQVQDNKKQLQENEKRIETLEQAPAKEAKGFVDNFKKVFENKLFSTIATAVIVIVGALVLGNLHLFK